MPTTVTPPTEFEMMIRDVFCTLRYRPFTSLERAEGYQGICITPERSRGIVEIDSELGEDALFEVTLHELPHLAFPDIKEEAVTEGARDIAQALTELGYRMEKKQLKALVQAASVKGLYE